uniref:CSON005027 protein n=2 Tax=Culicoides sonorensis TaxID=179676 RepID=A0A336MPX6_CULSO
MSEERDITQNIQVLEETLGKIISRGAHSDEGKLKLSILKQNVENVAGKMEKWMHTILSNDSDPNDALSRTFDNFSLKLASILSRIELLSKPLETFVDDSVIIINDPVVKIERDVNENLACGLNEPKRFDSDLEYLGRITMPVIEVHDDHMGASQMSAYSVTAGSVVSTSPDISMDLDVNMRDGEASTSNVSFCPLLNSTTHDIPSTSHAVTDINRSKNNLPMSQLNNGRIKVVYASSSAAQNNSNQSGASTSSASMKNLSPAPNSSRISNTGAIKKLVIKKAPAVSEASRIPILNNYSQKTYAKQVQVPLQLKSNAMQPKIEAPEQQGLPVLKPVMVQLKPKKLIIKPFKPQQGTSALNPMAPQVEQGASALNPIALQAQQGASALNPIALQAQQGASPLNPVELLTEKDPLGDLNEKTHQKSQEIPKKVDKPFLKCPICLCEPMKEPMSLFCGHIFCKDCINDALKIKKKCPTCNKVVAVTKMHRIYLN